MQPLFANFELRALSLSQVVKITEVDYKIVKGKCLKRSNFRFSLR